MANQATDLVHGAFESLSRDSSLGYSGVPTSICIKLADFFFHICIKIFTSGCSKGSCFDIGLWLC